MRKAERSVKGAVRGALVISEPRTGEPVKRDLSTRTFAANCR